MNQRNILNRCYDTAEESIMKTIRLLTIPAPNDTAKKQPVVPLTNSFSMVMAQSLWDATMAYSIAGYWGAFKTRSSGKRKVSSDEGFAVVTLLKKYSPNAKVLVISCGPDDSFSTGKIEWNKFTGIGDYIIITDPKLPKTFEE
jgi:hypothetical protein